MGGEPRRLVPGNPWSKRASCFAKPGWKEKARPEKWEVERGVGRAPHPHAGTSLGIWTHSEVKGQDHSYLGGSLSPPLLKGRSEASPRLERLQRQQSYRGPS